MWLIWATYINMSSMVLSLTPTIHIYQFPCMHYEHIWGWVLWPGHRPGQPETNPPEIKPPVTIESIQRLQLSLECFLDSCWPISHYIPYTYNIPISNLLLNSNKRMGITSFWNRLILWFMFPSSTQLYVMHLQYRKEGGRHATKGPAG